jgi:hypothetical protein
VSCLGDVSSRLSFASSGGYENEMKHHNPQVLKVIPIKLTINSLKLRDQLHTESE